MMDAATDGAQIQDQSKPRKIIKAKRRDRPEEKLVDEDGNEISFEDDSDDLGDNAAYIDDEVVDGQDSDEWADVEGEEDMQDDADGKKKTKDKAAEEKSKDEKADEKMGQVWNEEQQPLKPDEELDFDSSAYEMLHRSEVEWPCLSIDVLVRERCPEASQPFTFRDWFSGSSLNQLGPENSQMNKKLGISEHNNDKYPMSVYFCGGSQGTNKNENKIYVMKWSEMVKTLHDDD
jgi:ribosome assembly protein RRB1